MPSPFRYGTADYLRHHVAFLSEIGQHLHQQVTGSLCCAEMHLCYACAAQDHTSTNPGNRSFMCIICVRAGAPLLHSICVQVVVDQLVAKLEELFFIPVICESIKASVAEENQAGMFAFELLRFLIQQLGPSPILTRLCACLLGTSMEVAVVCVDEGGCVQRQRECCQMRALYSCTDHMRSTLNPPPPTASRRQSYTPLNRARHTPQFTSQHTTLSAHAR